MGQACSVVINACQPVYISMYSELFQLSLQRQRRLMHGKQTQVLDAVDGVDIGVTAIEPCSILLRFFFLLIVCMYE